MLANDSCERKETTTNVAFLKTHKFFSSRRRTHHGRLTSLNNMLMTWRFTWIHLGERCNLFLNAVQKPKSASVTRGNTLNTQPQ